VKDRQQQAQAQNATSYPNLAALGEEWKGMSAERKQAYKRRADATNISEGRVSSRKVPKQK